MSPFSIFFVFLFLTFLNLFLICCLDVFDVFFIGAWAPDLGPGGGRSWRGFSWEGLFWGRAFLGRAVQRTLWSLRSHFEIAVLEHFRILYAADAARNHLQEFSRAASVNGVRLHSQHLHGSNSLVGCMHEDIRGQQLST